MRGCGGGGRGWVLGSGYLWGTRVSGRPPLAAGACGFWEIDVRLVWALLLPALSVLVGRSPLLLAPPPPGTLVLWVGGARLRAVGC